MATVGTAFRIPSCNSALHSLTATFTWGVLTPFRDAPQSKGGPSEPSQLNYGRVFAAELGYLVMLVAATVECCVRALFALFVSPFVCGGCVSDKSELWLFAFGGVAFSAITAMNCATALSKNLYEPQLTTSDFCLSDEANLD